MFPPPRFPALQTVKPSRLASRLKAGLEEAVASGCFGSSFHTGCKCRACRPDGVPAEQIQAIHTSSEHDTPDCTLTFDASKQIKYYKDVNRGFGLPPWLVRYFSVGTIQNQSCQSCHKGSHM